MNHSKERGFGVELKELTFRNTWDWIVNFDDDGHYWRTEPTYLIVHFLFLLGGTLTFIHAMKNGKRFPYLWLGTLLHGLVIELMCYIMPDIDNFWHSQTPIMLVGRRLPLHIVFLYPVFVYNSTVAVSKLRLPRWAAPFAVGLGSVLIDLPYDIVSVRFLHWTWHDTDPNIADRHYWVPWNSYYFHATFAASFTFWFSTTRSLLCKNGQQLSVCKEMFCTILSSLLGMPGGILMFLPIYHPLHDIFKLHSEVTFFILFTVFMAIIWTGLNSARRAADGKDTLALSASNGSCLLFGYLVLHYASFWLMTVLFNPEDEVSIGLHERIGPCDVKVPIRTAFGMTLEKRKYLCVDDFDEKYFDFKCLPKPPSDGAYWYTACGVPFENRAEYVAIIAAVGLLGLTVYYNLHYRANRRELQEERKPQKSPGKLKEN